ncbi:MAG: hypothetical protein ACK40L_15170, partial [Hydrogenophaga sp.]
MSKKHGVQQKYFVMSNRQFSFEIKHLQPPSQAPTGKTRTRKERLARNHPVVLSEEAPLSGIPNNATGDTMT